ncbi:hypothetical protein A7K94_0218800, partial [Modestobacter sp. VKM Ac-2676]
MFEQLLRLFEERGDSLLEAELRRLFDDVVFEVDGERHGARCRPLAVEAEPGRAEHLDAQPAEVEPAEAEPGQPEPGETEPGETEPGETEPGCPLEGETPSGSTG